MSKIEDEFQINNIIYHKIDNGINDEEIIINEKTRDIENYKYYQNNKLFNSDNHLGEGECEEDSDDTIVAFQEEKESNLLDNNFNDAKSENNLDIEIEKEESTENLNQEKESIADNKTEKLKSNNINNNNLIKRPSKTTLKKKKKKKKKEKEGKAHKIEIYAHDKILKQMKLNNLLKKVKIDKKKDKNVISDETEKSLLKKKLSSKLNQIKSRRLSNSIKQISKKMSNSSREFPKVDTISEKAMSDDEEEIKKILKKRKKRKTNLKPIMTPFLLSIKEKNEYNLRLQKIRQQFTEKKFVNEQKYFYYVLKPGNGAALVKNALKHRINWKECQMNVTSLFNFKWQTSNMCIDYNRLSSVESIPQMVNQFEFHNTISNKSSMFLNLFQYCESNNINIWKYVPLTVFISPNNENEKNFDALYDNIKNYIKDYNDINKNIDKGQKSEKYSNLFKTMTCNVYGRRKDLPKDTWMMGSRTPIEIPDTHYEGKNLWVLKASNLNRGQCIRLLDSKEKFHEIIKDWSQGIKLNNSNKGFVDNNIQFRVNSESNPTKSDEIPMSDTYKTERIIVQKYIENPLCYYGRKCDMRIWVMLTQDMKVFVYKEGHLKTCSEKYDINNQKDAFIHITNYSFQKHCLNFQKFELGNEVPFYDFQKFLDKEFKEYKIDVKKHIMDQVKYIVGITMKSVKDKINANNRNFCFEIYGYDFMLDKNLNVYLLEVNRNPGLEISSPWIKAIVPRMIDDALRLTIDVIFPPKYQFDKNTITELNYEEYTNEIIHKEEGKKVEEGKNEDRRIVKRKKFTMICDQGAGTQDQQEEKYLQENLRQKEIKIQKKINNTKIEDIKNNDNNDTGNNKEKEINKEKEKKNVEELNNKKDNTLNEKDEKKAKEKIFDQKNYKSPYPVPGYEPWENLWELICDLNEEKLTNQNNYTYMAGVRGLLEIQKKRQSNFASTPKGINNNIKMNNKSNSDSHNNQKDKNMNINQKDISNNELKKGKKNENKEKKIDLKNVIKKNSENLKNKELSSKDNKLNKKKEKDIINKNNNKKNKEKIQEENKNNEINKENLEKNSDNISKNNKIKEDNQI